MLARDPVHAVFRPLAAAPPPPCPTRTQPATRLQDAPRTGTKRAGPTQHVRGGGTGPRAAAAAAHTQRWRRPLLLVQLTHVQQVVLRRLPVRFAEVQLDGVLARKGPIAESALVGGARVLLRGRGQQLF